MTDEKKASNLTLLALLALCLGVFLTMVWPYLFSLFMGLLLAILSRPLYEALVKRRLGPQMAAGDPEGPAATERASAATLSRPHDRRLSGRDTEMVLNAAYLVPAEGVAAFRAIVEDLARRHEADGVELELR